MKLIIIAAAVVALAHGLNTTVTFNPKMSPAELKVAQAKWEANMKAPPPVASSLTCSSDFRSNFPSCIQYAPEWCWATAVSEIWAFFNPTALSHMQAGNCHGYECQVAGHVLYPANANKCCDSGMMSTCGQRAGYPNDITGAIYWSTSKTYDYIASSISQQQLDDILSEGYPVAIAVSWSNGNGGHMLTLGGCAGGGYYYLHDPAAGEGGQANHYQTLTYQQILQYYPPNGVSGVYGAWHQTFTYASGKTVVV